MPRSVYNASWVPDLTPEQLSFEKGWLLGEILCAMAYGVVLALFPICFYLLSQQRSESPRQKMILLVYICTVFGLNTIFLGGNTEFTINCFIDFREYPGGPGQFEQDMFSITADEVANVAYVIANWLSDIILVWRCYVVFMSMGGSISLWIVMAITGTIYLASFLTGLFFLIQISSTSPFGSSIGGVNWTVPYFAISMGLTVFCTAAIVARVLLYRRRIRATLGDHFAGQYLSLASMMVESGLIWTVYSLVFVITFTLGSPAAPALLQSSSPVQTIASLLILFRVARGRSWDTTASTTINITGSGPRSGGSIPMFVVRKPNQTYEQNTTRDVESVQTKPRGVLVEREVMMDYARTPESEFPLDQKI